MVLTEKHIGCCGAFCGTCKDFTAGICKGCKLGYEGNKRSISRARCKMKLCCFRDKGLETCADCEDLDSCEIIQPWYARKPYKYRKYQQSIEFIRAHGYEAFLSAAKDWNGAYGKLPE